MLNSKIFMKVKAFVTFSPKLKRFNNLIYFSCFSVLFSVFTLFSAESLNVEFPKNGDVYSIGDRIVIKLNHNIIRESVPAFIWISFNAGKSWHPIHDEPIEVKYSSEVNVYIYDSLKLWDGTSVSSKSSDCMIRLSTIAQDIECQNPQSTFHIIPAVNSVTPTTSNNWLNQPGKEPVFGIKSSVSCPVQWPFETDNLGWGIMGCKWMRYHGCWEQSRGATGICYSVAVASLVNHLNWPQNHTFTYRDETNNNALAAYSFVHFFPIINGNLNDCSYDPASRLRRNYDPGWTGASEWDGVDELGELVKSVEMAINSKKNDVESPYPMVMRRKFVDVLRNRFGYANAAWFPRTTPDEQLEIPELESKLQANFAKGIPVIAMENGSHAWVIDGFQDKASNVASYAYTAGSKISVKFTDGTSRTVSIADAVTNKYCRLYHRSDFGEGNWQPLFLASAWWCETDWVYDLDPDVFLPAVEGEVKKIEYVFGNNYQKNTSNTSRRARFNLYSPEAVDVGVYARVYRADYIPSQGIWVKASTPLLNEYRVIPANGKIACSNIDYSVADSMKLILEFELDAVSIGSLPGLRFVKDGICNAVLTSNGDFRVGRVNRVDSPPGFRFLNDRWGYIPWSIDNGRAYILRMMEAGIQHWYRPPQNPSQGSIAFRNESGALISEMNGEWMFRGYAGAKIRVLLDDEER